MNYSVTHFGKKLHKSKYTIDHETKSFSSDEDHLVLDFSYEDGWTFKTGSNCTFDTGYSCAFNTGYSCTFDTGSDCTFNTGSDCTFKTEWNCTFKTGSICTFRAGSHCTFDTGSDCTFNTGSDCTFKTQRNCTLLCWTNSKRYFLDESNYVLTRNKLIEIKDKNQAILNMKHNEELVRDLCKRMLRGAYE